MLELPHSLNVKWADLQRRLGNYTSLGIAFSGGVDSTLLLAAAKRVLGDNALALTVRSAIHSADERRQAIALAKVLGVRHHMIHVDVLSDRALRNNGPQRCYHCKRMVFQRLQAEATKLGLDALVHGANTDDARDYRPGQRAAEELGVDAPLSAAQLSKADIRTLARHLKLANWDRPAMACLATRIPYGTRLEAAMLSRIEQAEGVVRKCGFAQCRVRVHEDLARIEIDAGDMARMLDASIRGVINDALQALGFQHVCLDLEGYVTGKMNRTLAPSP